MDDLLLKLFYAELKSSEWGELRDGREHRRAEVSLRRGAASRMAPQ